MLTLIYPYRNRNLARVKRSLDSLKSQSEQSFKVAFVDYGSRPELASEIKKLLDTYGFATYTYHPVQHQPWNKCKALNSVIKTLEGGYCFVADVDMIFHPDFIARAKSMQHPEKAVYFKVGFLSEVESAKNLPYSEYKIKFESDEGATGLTLMPVDAAKKLRGFDEFYHFWGSEDTDMHVRLKYSGIPVSFYSEEILLLHQHHVIYRNKEDKALTEELRVSNIVRINHRHLQTGIAEGRSTVNPQAWGMIPSREDMEQLAHAEVEVISNAADEVDEFLYARLPQLKKGVHAFKFVQKKNKGAKQLIKQSLGKHNIPAIDMKQLNDRILLHLIAFHRNVPYSFVVDTKEPSIELRIKC
ncbi:MAG: glycosyltransferase [Flavobacterium sp.]|nr:MAG: glycosyltransferase [Flavobacterium sp.]